MRRNRKLLSLARVVTLSTATALALAGCGSGAAPKSAASQSGAKASASNNSAAFDPTQYTGADREQKLASCATSESGDLVLYTSGLGGVGDPSPVLDAFQKKYPTIKVKALRTDSTELTQRLVEEYHAKKYVADLIETTASPLITLKDAGMLQPYKLGADESAHYPSDSRQPDGYWYSLRESYIGMGYNTNLISKDEAPHSFQDLLDPKWKGKMAIPSSSTGVRWVGAILLKKGKDFLDKLAKTADIHVQNVGGVALTELVVSGEVPLSPTIYNSHVKDRAPKGAPIAWTPLDFALVNVGAMALPSKSTRPCKAMLLMDFAYSKEGQTLLQQKGYSSARDDIESTDGSFKKLYLENLVKSYTKSYAEWQQVMKAEFLSK